MTERPRPSDRPIRRRDFLRGVGGLALTLPWLESFPARAEDSAAEVAHKINDKMVKLFSS